MPSDANATSSLSYPDTDCDRRPLHPSSANSLGITDQVIELSTSSDDRGRWPRQRQQAQPIAMTWLRRTRSTLCRYAPLVPPTTLLITLVVVLVQARANDADSSEDSSGVFPPGLQWSVCPRHVALHTVNNASIQCANLTLPLCYEGFCPTQDEIITITVSFKRIPATKTNGSGTSPVSVWYLPDRPDVQTSKDVEREMQLLSDELQGDVDIYTLDLRGSGESSPLTCTASDGSSLETAIFTRNEGVLTPRDVQVCACQLEELGYTDLRAFSLASASRDIAEVITQFQSRSQTVVYALGYGTLVAQQLMLQNISQILGYVLDGVLLGPANATIPSTYPGSYSDYDFGEVAEDILALCQTDAECSKLFQSTSLKVTLAQVYARLDDDNPTKCSAILANGFASGKNNSARNLTTPPSYRLRQLLGDLMQNSTLWPFIPVLIYRFHRCDSEDVTILSNFESTFRKADDVKPLELLYAIQTYSELWETPSPNQTELKKRFTDPIISSGHVYTQLNSYCLFTGSSSNACSNMSTSLQNFSRTHKTLSYANLVNEIAVPFETSVLFLSGIYDVVSPPKYSTALFHSLPTDNKALIIVPTIHNIVHSALISNGAACAREMLASYVRSGGNLSSTSMSCLATVSAPNLTLSNTTSLQILGVEDAYDGVFDRNRTKKVVIRDDTPEQSGAPSSSTSDTLSRRILALESSQRCHQVARNVVTSLLGASLFVGAVGLLYQRRRKQQLREVDRIGQRESRGDHDHELELVHSLYLLSSPPPGQVIKL